MNHELIEQLVSNWISSIGDKELHTLLDMVCDEMYCRENGEEE